MSTEYATLFDPEATGGQVTSNAIISEDGLYRYSLARWWDNGAPTDIWIMCNPSTADATVDDATIRRCTGFSRRFGSGGFVVVNCYGYRATKPADMWRAQQDGTDIIGPENDGWIRAHCKTSEGRVIVAWGAHPMPARAWVVASLVRAAGREPLCLGTTKTGAPRHPLYVPGSQPLVPLGGLPT